MIPRIAVLGGSSVYAPEFVQSVISHNLNVKEIVLIGRSAHKLKLVSGFCQRLLNKRGFPALVHGTDNVQEGVRGAKYILNNIRVGGMQARLRDEKTPPRMGMIGDESLGAGGFANAMRTLPVLFEYARIMEETAPNATLINLTNPIGICVEALLKYSKLNVIGASDLPGGYIKQIAELLHHDPMELAFDYIGLNQLGWFQDVKCQGRSLMPRIFERMELLKDDGFDTELIELFHMIPTRRVGIFFHKDVLLKKQESTARYRAEILYEAERQILRLYEDEHLADIPDLTRARNAAWYEETIVPLIEALERSEPSEHILCVRNGGAIRDLPDNCSVELAASVSKEGVSVQKVGSCPRFLKGLFFSVKESDRLTVEAVRHRSYEYALQALTTNPLVPSLDAAKAYLHQLIQQERIELH